MTNTQSMSPLRRAMPGMSAPTPRDEIAPAPEAPPAEPEAQTPEPRWRRGRDRRSRDYAATRLVNFRLPVDLHDRYRELVQEVEKAHPRIRRPSLTEVLIGLLEEGPQTTDGVAELIRRKRASEYTEEGSR
jgi:hypothetical protein